MHVAMYLHNTFVKLHVVNLYYVISKGSWGAYFHKSTVIYFGDGGPGILTCHINLVKKQCLCMWSQKHSWRL